MPASRCRALRTWAYRDRRSTCHNLSPSSRRIAHSEIFACRPLHYRMPLDRRRCVAIRSSPRSDCTSKGATRRPPPAHCALRLGMHGWDPPGVQRLGAIRPPRWPHLRPAQRSPMGAAAPRSGCRVPVASTSHSPDLHGQPCESAKHPAGWRGFGRFQCRPKMHLWADVCTYRLPSTVEFL